jgi:death on curing protein
VLFWLDRATVDAIHYDQLRQHGGLRRIKDENALESALARPRNRLAYEPGSDLFTLAAAYGFGLATNHAYNDGNKRVAFMVMYVFLGMNGWVIDAAEADVVPLMLDVAAGKCEEVRLADWLCTHARPFSE